MVKKRGPAQAAVIPIRLGEEGVEIALISSRKGKRWIVPKGNREVGESLRTTAVREAMEEGGFVGWVSDDPVGHYELRKPSRRQTVEVYVMVVERLLDRWPERGLRQRQWVKMRNVKRWVKQPGLRRLLRELTLDEWTIDAIRAEPSLEPDLVV